mgnify:FL=1
MYKYFLFFSFVFVDFNHGNNINYMYHSGYFYDESPSIFKVNLESQIENYTLLDFELILPNAFLYDVSKDQSHILLCEYNQEETILDFDNLPPLVLYNYMEKDTLVMNAYNGKFTHDNDKILYIKVDSIISPFNQGGDGYMSSIMSYSISDQESVLIANSVAGVEYQMSHDRSRILFYVGDPENDNAQIVIHDLTLDVSDTLVYNSGFPPIYNSMPYKSFFWGKDNNLYIPSIYYPEASDTILAIYKLDVAENPENPSLLYSLEEFTGGYVVAYNDHSVNKFVMTAAQIDQSYGGYCSFDIGTGELDFINGYGSPYVIPTINTWSADSSKVIMGYFGVMGLQLGLSVSDINTGHLNFSSAYFPGASRYYGHNICTFEVSTDSVLSDLFITYPNSLDTLYFNQNSLNNTTTFNWELNHSQTIENVNYTISFWYSEYSDILGYIRNQLFETTIDTNQITFLNSFIQELYNNAYESPDFGVFGWSVRASDGMNLGHDIWDHAFLGVSIGDFQAQSNEELFDAVNLWIFDNDSALSLYGHISSWDVSSITNMSGLFSNHNNFNENISFWDVSNVTSMSAMFYGAKKFNQNISNWDVSNVTNMAQMFFDADSFDQDISSWEVSNVNNMENIFDIVTNNLSDENKCAIHNSWSEETTAWIYDWSTFCSLNNHSMNETPKTYNISQNYPNPFNPITTLQYELPEDSFVNVTVYDMLGNVVNNLINANQSSGYKSIQWNATNNQGKPVSAGVYLYEIQAGDFVDTKKMILLK